MAASKTQQNLVRIFILSRLLTLTLFHFSQVVCTSGAGVGVGSILIQPRGLRMDEDSSKKAIFDFLVGRRDTRKAKSRSPLQRDCLWKEENPSHLFRLD